MPPVVAADADADRPGAGWSALCCAIVESGIRDRDRHFLESTGFALLVEATGVTVPADACRDAIKRRWRDARRKNICDDLGTVPCDNLGQ
jgi:hypothetical protein